MSSSPILKLSAATRDADADADAGNRPSVVRAVGLSKSLGLRPVLTDVCLDVAAGDCVALTGANGTGKTTLLRCLAGETRPTSGSIEWFGQSTGAVAVPKQRIGVVAHDTRLYPDLSARENLLFAARMCRVPDAGQRVDECLQRTGLIRQAHRSPAQFSRGMQQRLALARALIHDPDLILLDEPFTGLDQAGTEWLCDLLRAQRDRGRALVLATHDRLVITALAARVALLSGCRLTEDSLPVAA